MHVMEMVSGAGTNGAIIHCLLLTRQLLRRGHQVTLVCRPQAWIAEQLRGEDVNIIESDMHRIPTDELRRMAALARQRRVEVVHTHMSRAHAFGVLLRWMGGPPCVATAHNARFQLHWMWNDFVIATSADTFRFHRRYNLVPQGRIETVHNFIDDEQFAQLLPHARSHCRQELGIDASALVLGTIGNVIPRKGLKYLVEALPDILDRVPQARLLVVGNCDSPYAGQVKATARRMGTASRIIWAGQRGEMAALFSALDLYVLPSVEESFPLSVLEAMAASLPVVATTVGGLPECVVGGQTGCLVPPARPGALSEVIVPLLRDGEQRRQWGEAGRQRIRSCFSMVSQIPRIEAILDRTARQVA